MEMFGDPAKNDEKYPVIKLENVANVKSSHRVFTSDFVQKGIPFYRGKEIAELSRLEKPTNLIYISEEKYEEVAKDDSKPLVGDLLMPSICDKGQVWMVDSSRPFYYKDGRVLCISPDRSKIDSKYFQFYLKMKTIAEYPKLGSGSTFAEFKIFQLKNLMVSLPLLSLQRQFAKFEVELDKSKLSTENSRKMIQNVIKYREK